MKIRRIFLTLVLFMLLSACGSVGELQLPFLSTPTFTPAPVEAASLTPTVTVTRTPTSTPTVTPTLTPQPTRTSPYPVGVGTPVPDVGFLEIGVGNAPQLTPVLKIVDQNIWHAAVSRDDEQLFVATSNGLLVYDRQGKQIAHWPSIILYHLPCESCLSVDMSGSRFAVAIRKDGKWEAQVYNVDGTSADLLFSRPMEAVFKGAANEVRVALSPDGKLLAYSAGDGDTLVVEIEDSETLLTYKGQATGLVFSPDGAAFAIRRGREMLFWKTETWKNPSNLLLPAEDTPYAFSPDGARIAVALAAKVRIYALDTLTPAREIAVQPTNAVNRTWQLIFLDQKTLRGYGIRWNGQHTTATVDVMDWDMDSGETLKSETTQTDSPDALSALWGATIAANVVASDIPTGQYNRFRFVNLDALLINSQHSACWVKLSTGEKTCSADPEYTVLASDASAYREVPQDKGTLLQNWNGGNLFEVLGPYRIIAVDKSAKFILVNVNNFTVDLYFNTKKLPVESVAGRLLDYAESIDHIVIMAQQSSSVYSITLVDKNSQETLYQKKDSFILKPLAIANDGKVYFVQQDPDRPEVVLKVIDPKTRGVKDVTRLSLPAEPQVLALSASGTFALGLRDGSVMIVSADGLTNVGFQALYSPISGISFTSDGRYLAVAGDEGMRVFAVLP